MQRNKEEIEETLQMKYLEQVEALDFDFEGGIWAYLTWTFNIVTA